LQVFLKRSLLAEYVHRFSFCGLWPRDLLSQYLWIDTLSQTTVLRKRIIEMLWQNEFAYMIPESNLSNYFHTFITCVQSSINRSSIR
jgi:hypothetical protein